MIQKTKMRLLFETAYLSFMCYHSSTNFLAGKKHGVVGTGLSIKAFKENGIKFN